MNPRTEAPRLQTVDDRLARIEDLLINSQRGSTESSRADRAFVHPCRRRYKPLASLTLFQLAGTRERLCLAN
jgi:hypothetical protein